MLYLWRNLTKVNMFSIPQSESLSTKKLGQVFNNTTAAYKFYWFQSILQMHVEEGINKISVWDIVIRMVANAWYPVHYFRLSFGSQDSLNKIITELQWYTRLPMDAKSEDIITCLKENLDKKEIKNLLSILTKNVPYRFLSPWINTSNDKQLIERSHTLENGCLYSISKSKDDFSIIMNPAWDQYLSNYYGILKDFLSWNLTLFLQARNPNVPNIPNKLTRPQERVSLSKQRKFWKEIIIKGGDVHCIYTNRKLNIDCFAVDHFIPWSFVAHDQLWNLIPSDISINSSKNDRLPALDKYLVKLAEEHRNAIRIYLKTGGSPDALEDFSALGYNPQDLLVMNRERFISTYQQTFNPLFQIAQNMGYEVWSI